MNKFCFSKKNFFVLMFALIFITSSIYFINFFTKNPIKSKAASSGKTTGQKSARYTSTTFYPETNFITMKLKKNENIINNTEDLESKCFADYTGINFKDHLEKAYAYHLNPSKKEDECVTYVEFQPVILPRIDMAAIAITPNVNLVSNASFEEIMNTINSITELANISNEKIKLRFFLFKFTGLQLGRTSLEIIDSNSNNSYGLGDQFNMDLILPTTVANTNNYNSNLEYLKIDPNSVDVISITFHELNHLARAYNLYKNDLNPISQSSEKDKDEEYMTDFFSTLLEYYLKTYGLKGNFLGGFIEDGLYRDTIAYKLDRLNFQPYTNPTDFQLYKFFYDYSLGYGYKYLVDHTENVEKNFNATHTIKITLMTQSEKNTYLALANKVKSDWKTLVDSKKYEGFIKENFSDMTISKFFFQEKPFSLGLSLINKPLALQCENFAGETACIRGCSQKYTLQYKYMTDFRCFNTTCCFIPSLLPY